SGVMAIRVPAEEFHRVAQKYPQLASMMTDIVAERLGRRDQDALSGKVLQGYRIERMLGRGGNGIVYLAVDLATQDRVALKMMSHRLVYSDRARVLFQKEAETVSRMNHPGIIRLRTSFDAFHTCFIVFDLVEGQTLAARMEAHSLQTDEIESVLVGLAETLRYAHARGVIHRDLKPANVMILPSGRVCLMDFGLAAGPEESGVICGTPRYMAPEQRVGKKLTPASDWFALGVIGYEMFVGRPLFGGDATEELGRSFHQWDPDFSRLFDTRLGTSIAHMLRVDPRERIPFPRSSDT
ncbi:MAG: serine/threonine-protein kinase, partial [Planctomycetota bacterium]